MSVDNEYIYIVLSKLCYSTNEKRKFNICPQALIFDKETYDKYMKSHGYDDSNCITLVLNPKHPKFIKKDIDLQYVEGTSSHSIVYTYCNEIPLTMEEDELAQTCEDTVIQDINANIQNVKELMIDTYFKFTKEEMVIIDEAMSCLRNHLDYIDNLRYDEPDQPEIDLSMTYDDIFDCKSFFKHCGII